MVVPVEDVQIPFRVRRIDGVNGAGDELLAGAGLAVDQDRRAGERHFHDPAKDSPPQRAVADENPPDHRRGDQLIDELPVPESFAQTIAELPGVLPRDHIRGAGVQQLPHVGSCEHRRGGRDSTHAFETAAAEAADRFEHARRDLVEEQQTRTTRVVLTQRIDDDPGEREVSRVADYRGWTEALTPGVDVPMLPSGT